MKPAASETKMSLPSERMQRVAFDYLEAHPDCDGVVMTLEDTGERYMFVRADEQKQAADSTN